LHQASEETAVESRRRRRQDREEGDNEARQRGDEEARQRGDREERRASTCQLSRAGRTSRWYATALPSSSFPL